jgi:hypothetical protein
MPLSAEDQPCQSRAAVYFNYSKTMVLSSDVEVINLRVKPAILPRYIP